jgi:hypothetical protein
VAERRWRRWGILILAAAFVSLGGFLLHVALWRPLPLAGAEPADGYQRLAGVVHVHTSLSDGGGSPQEVIAAARAAGLGFLAVSDHNNLDAKRFEGYQDGVLVLVGSELSTPSGHVLGLGLTRDPVFRFNGDAQDALEDVRDLGGAAFAAHPFSGRSDLRWTGWELPGPWGIELLNGDSEWRRAGPRLLLTLGLYQLNPRYALLHSLVPPDEALRRWDEILSHRDAVGIAGADAHSRLPISKGRVLRFPAYESLFALFREHVLLERPLVGEPAADRAAVVDAFRRGHAYIGVDAIAPADGFSFTVARASGERFTMGDSVRPGADLRARAGGRMPKGTRLALLRDGVPIAQAQDALDVPVPGPGVYRVEAHAPGWQVPWVITNAVTVVDAAGEARRQAAAAWPVAPSPRTIRPLASLPGSAAFQAEFDPSSWMDEPAASPQTPGPQGTPALRLSFRLGEPSKEQPFTWCALVNRQARDLSGYAGLRFWLKGDDEYRIWVQVRDVNPASADAGLEWWLASARSSREWREVLLPFSRFRTINKHSDGALSLAEVRAIVFVLDRASVKVGTRGTLWIAEPGVYR